MRRYSINFKLYNTLNGGKILGYNFVENNKYNCEIIFNNIKYELTEYFEIEINSNNKYNINREYFLIKIIIKSNTSNLSYMFDNCKSLIEIVELYNLNLKNLTNLSHIFCGCSHQIGTLQMLLI